jgi:hypothetical protein
MAKKDQPPRRRSGLQGVGRLLVEGTAGLTDLVEAMHATIGAATSAVGARPKARSRGLARAAYERVRAVNRLVGQGLDAALPLFDSTLAAPPSSPRRERLLAVLNGVIGDHLAATDNPLAIPMHFRSGGQPTTLSREGLAGLPSPPTRKILVLLHGLCESDRTWVQDGHDHGQALARDLGYTPVYLHYNTGRHISANGRDFAEILEALVERWPEPVEDLTLLAHSMGGLVARSACHVARKAGTRWMDRLSALVFLGTPHHGTPLERVGNLFEHLLDVSAYSAPLGAIGGRRSAGIQDLRFGNLLDEDWSDRERRDRRDRRSPVPLPDGVACFAVAATLSGPAADLRGRLRGDGLVPVASALGQHESARFALAFPRSHRFIARGTRHRQLLGAPAVYRRVEAWLEAKPAPGGLRPARSRGTRSPSTGSA